MKSATLPSFWKEYDSLELNIRKRAGIWSVRVTISYRAVGPVGPQQNEGEMS